MPISYEQQQLEIQQERPLSLDDLPPEISFLVFQWLDGLNDIASLGRINKNYQEQFKSFLSTPTGARLVLNVLEKLHDRNRNYTLPGIIDWLNRMGIVEVWKNQSDEASQLAYALTTTDVKTIPWKEIEPILNKKVKSLPIIVNNLREIKNCILSEAGERSLGDGYYNLRGANLQGVTLNVKEQGRVNLQSADLQGATLKGNFNSAHLQNANLQSATLSGSFLYAHLQNANLQSATLSGRFLYAHLQNANLQSATLSGIFLDAHLQNVNLQGATLKGISDKANLQNANLQSATLAGMFVLSIPLYLENADLRGVNLKPLRKNEASDALEKKIGEQIREQRKELYNRDISKANTLEELQKVWKFFCAESKCTIITGAEGETFYLALSQDFCHRVTLPNLYYAELPEQDIIYNELCQKTKEIAGITHAINPDVALMIAAHLEKRAILFSRGERPLAKENVKSQVAFFSDKKSEAELKATEDYKITLADLKIIATKADSVFATELKSTENRKITLADLNAIPKFNSLSEAESKAIESYKITLDTLQATADSASEAELKAIESYKITLDTFQATADSASEAKFKNYRITLANLKTIANSDSSKATNASVKEILTIIENTEKSRMSHPKALQEIYAIVLAGHENCSKDEHSIHYFYEDCLAYIDTLHRDVVEAENQNQKSFVA